LEAIEAEGTALKRSAISPERPDPTMEDAFIHLVESADREMEATI
jgi:ABC-2 type transport system ATP-binding protein